VYAGNVNVLGEIINTIKKRTEALSEANSRKIGVEVKTEKTKNMILSYQQTGGQNYILLMPKNPLKMWHNSSIWEQQW